MPGVPRGIVAVCIGVAAASGYAWASTAEDVMRVENSLLPPVLISGAPAYSLNDRMGHYHVPGVSITVIRDFEIIWTRVYGVVDQETGPTVDENTLFAVGSLSKAATAVGVLRLVQEGKLDLDGEINSQLRSWQLEENEFTRQAAVTPRLLMNHSAGLRINRPFPSVAGQIPTLLQHLNGEAPPGAERVQVDHVPGTRFLYSNGGFSILQQAIEDHTGQSFAEYMQQAVLAPLGMEHSSFAAPLPESLRQMAATGHNRVGGPLQAKQYYMPNASAGGLWTTTSDYARLVIELQESLRGRSNRILEAELVDAMLSPHAASEYGLGVFLQERRGERYFRHIGDAAGFIAGFAAHRTDGYGAVVCVNGMGGIGLVREILQAVGQVYAWQGFLPEEITPRELPAGFQEAVIGRYRTGPDAVLTVEWEAGELRMRSAGEPVTRIYPTAPDTFVCRERFGELTFLRDEAGLATAALVRLADEVGRFPDTVTPAPRMPEDAQIPSEMLTAGETEQAMQAYLELQRSNPDAPFLRESRFNSLGYHYLGQGQVDLAIAVFRINLALYPRSANAYDSLGEAYMKAGERQLAITNYERSLDLNPDNSNATRMLESLRGQN